MAPRSTIRHIFGLLVAGTLTLSFAATCGNGVTGVMTSDSKYCCPVSCGTCGGSDCYKRAGGAANCCTSQIKISCANVTKAPCLAVPVAPAPAPAPGAVCASGSIPDPTKKVCCPATCGSCGGTNCHKRPGGYANCCSGTVLSSNKVCSATVKAPCKIATSAPAPAQAPVDSTHELVPLPELMTPGRRLAIASDSSNATPLLSKYDHTCLDWNQGTNQYGTDRVSMYQCQYSDNQRWYQTTNQELKTKASSTKCLDLNTSNQQLAMYNCNGGWNQKWKILSEPAGMFQLTTTSNYPTTNNPIMVVDYNVGGQNYVTLYNQNTGSNQRFYQPVCPPLVFDGCSVPSGMSAYNLFTPPCNWHDLCWACGGNWGLTKQQCNDEFFNRMIGQCNNYWHEWYQGADFDYCAATAGAYKAAVDYTLGSNGGVRPTMTGCPSSAGFLDNAYKPGDNNGSPKYGYYPKNDPMCSICPGTSCNYS